MKFAFSPLSHFVDSPSLGVLKVQQICAQGHPGLLLTA